MRQLSIKFISALFAAILLPAALLAKEPVFRPDTLMTVEGIVTDDYLDTVSLRKTLSLNDYMTIGVQYGYNVARMSFNPSKRQGTQYLPNQFGILFTHYEKLFNYLPYFGLQAGIFKGQDGFRFKQNDEGEWSGHVDGATEAVFDYIEIPAMALMHIDLWNFKMMIGGGLYGAWRYNVHREGETRLGFNPDFSDAFKDYENKLDYGWTVTAGAALVFDPVEFHVTGRLRWGMNSLYEPNYNSPYYYRYAYPMDVVITAGVHFQLTKRTGKTSSQLRREARSIVYNEN